VQIIHHIISYHIIYLAQPIFDAITHYLAYPSCGGPIRRCVCHLVDNDEYNNGLCHYSPMCTI